MILHACLIPSIFRVPPERVVRNKPSNLLSHNIHGDLNSINRVLESLEKLAVGGGVGKVVLRPALYLHQRGLNGKELIDEQLDCDVCAFESAFRIG